jgi:putative oxidoreductase
MVAALLVAMFTVHLPYGFSAIKLIGVTAAGAQFGPPGFEVDLLYVACLAALVMGGSGPFAVDSTFAQVRPPRPQHYDALSVSSGGHQSFQPDFQVAVTRER